MSAAHILLVDDMIDHLELAKAIFEARGYTVTGATSAPEAINVLLNNPSVDIIISDVNMPNASGFELISMVRGDERYADIKFVFVTASCWSEDDRQKGLSLGADKFIFRPFEPRVLVTEIEQILPEGKRGKNTLPN